MATKIEVIGNYFIMTDTVSSETIIEKPLRDISYSDDGVNILITYKDSVIGNSFGYLLADLVDSTGSAFADYAALLLFLRENTGFNTAPGGSGAVATLQDLIRANGYAASPDGDTSVRFSLADEGGYHQLITFNSTTNYYAEIYIDPGVVYMLVDSPGGKYSEIDISDASGIKLQEQVGAGLRTTVEFNTAIAETTLNFPAKSAGTYTLATTSDAGLIGYTVATLPTGVQGEKAYVTDATTPTYLGTLTGGGAVVCPVFYNGTAWVSA